MPLNQPGSTNQHGLQLLHGFHVRRVQSVNARTASMINESLQYTLCSLETHNRLVTTINDVQHVKSARMSRQEYSLHKVKSNAD